MDIGLSRDAFVTTIGRGIDVNIVSFYGNFKLYSIQNLLRNTFSTVRYFCVFTIMVKIDLKELNIIS
jgi:hypothetical protein